MCIFVLDITFLDLSRCLTYLFDIISDTIHKMTDMIMDSSIAVCGHQMNNLRMLLYKLN